MNTFKLAQTVFRKPSYFLSFGFGSGLLPIAPGTWGTLAAIPLYYLMMNLSPYIYLTICVVAFVLGVWICEQVSRELGEHDYGGIVWDEIVGFLLTMFMVPKGVYWVLTGFILFRVFDIVKPQPIHWVDNKVQGGLGIMLDDVLAAFYAWIVIQCIVWGIGG